MKLSLQSFSVICFVLTASLSVSVKADNFCWNFNDGTEGWFNEGTRDWEYSGYSSPITVNVPNFLPSPTGEYLWLQDYLAQPRTGSINSPSLPIITVNNGDQVGIAIYRHLTAYNSDNNPVLSFVSERNTVKLPIVSSSANNTWVYVSAICGVSAQCCRTYPCTGYFSVDGEIYHPDDIISVDSIWLNIPTCS